MLITIIRWTSIVLSSSLLPSCGGGGGGGSSTPTTAAPASNSAPAFTVTEFSFTENTPVQFTVSASDPDGDNITITEANSGDGGLFQLDTSTGQVTALTVNSVFNFEDPLDTNRDNIYEQSFTLSDGTTTVTETITVTITNVIEPPRYLGATEFTAAEGVAGFAISATDDNSGELQFSLSGVDAAAFVYENGGINFVSPPDFENPSDADADNIYNLVLSITNTDATVDVNLTATISNFDEAPVCNSADQFSFAENSSGIVYTFSAVDPEGDVFSYDNFTVVAENLLFDNLSFDPASGAVTVDSNIDFEALTTPSGTISITAAGTQCSVSFTVTDVEGVATSGLKLLASASHIAPAGDVDGDGIEDLWLTVPSDGDPQGALVFGDYLMNAMPANTLDTSTAANHQVLPIHISATTSIGGSSPTLVSRPVSDIDGDSIDELLIGFTRCEACSNTRMMAYLVWGSTVQNNTASALILDELAANQVLALPFPTTPSDTVGFASDDYDVDGRADIAVSMPSPSEASFVIFGDYLNSVKASGSADLASQAQTQVLDLNIDYLSFPSAGEQLASVADIDTDSRPELVITTAQAVNVIYSSTIANGRSAEGLTIGVGFDLQINAIAGVGALNQQALNVDADNIPDIAWADPAGSLASIAIGSTFASTPNAKAIDDTVNTLISGSIASLGDVSGGGADELLLSLSSAFEPRTREVRLVTGEALNGVAPGFNLDLSTTLPGQTLGIGTVVANESLANTVTGFSDLDGDGREELIVSDSNRGEVYVIRGIDLANALGTGEEAIDMGALFNQE